MNSDPFERLSRANPVPGEMSPLSIEVVRGRLPDAVEPTSGNSARHRIATAENIDVTDEDMEKEIEHLAQHSGESATAVRANLTRQGALDRMKSKLRSEKTLDWLCQNSRTRTKTEEK